MQVNLRNVPGSYTTRDGAQERNAELQLMPGVTLAPGDNLFERTWLEQLPAGYREQINEWKRMGWIETDYDATPSPSADSIEGRVLTAPPGGDFLARFQRG